MKAYNSRYAAEEVKVLRPMTAEEAKKLSYGDKVIFLDLDDRWAEAKVNSEPKTWKRNKDRVRISLKFGMWHYFIAEFNKGMSRTDLMVKVENACKLCSCFGVSCSRTTTHPCLSFTKIDEYEGKD